MKPIALYSRSLQIVHKHSICSPAALLVAVLAVATVLFPIYFTFALNGNLWLTENQQRIQFEQPSVRFSYRYTLLGEYDHLTANPNQQEQTITSISEEKSPMDVSDETSPMSLLTSYKYLNDLLPERLQQQSVSIKHWSIDVNHDGIAEQIHLQFTFEPPPNRQLSFLSLHLELEARLKSAQSCSLQIPASLIIDRLPLGPSYRIVPGTEITVNGRLRFHQRTPFNCPSYIRGRKTFFQHLEPIPINSTTLGDYAMDSIANRISSNVGYLEFERAGSGLQWKPATDSGRGGQHIRVNVAIDIDEIGVRYWTSVGQQMFRVWMEYLMVLIVLAVVADRLKALLFGRLWVGSWEVMPWKKNE